MNMRDKAAFADLFIKFTKLYSREFCESTLELYWIALEEFSFAEVDAVFHKYYTNTDSGQYMPMPANLLKFLNGSSHAKASQAWEKLINAVARVGRYESVRFNDPLIHCIIEGNGGWIRFCQLNTKELTFFKQDFIKRYQDYLYQPPTYFPSHLVGVFEHMNQIQGYAIQPPVLIDNSQQKRNVSHPAISQDSQKVISFEKTSANSSTLTGNIYERNESS